VNHGLRRRAPADADWVRAFATRLGLPCTVEEVKVERAGTGLEDAARRARYAALSLAAERGGYDLIATGHTHTDQAETVLLRLIRGTGVHGLAGMAARRGMIIRPLIDITRAEVEEYCLRNDLEWLEDEMNTDDAFTRSHLRGEVLPLLRSLNPGADQLLVNVAEVLRDEDEVMEMAAESSLVDRDGGTDAAELAALHPALQRRGLRILYRRAHGSLESLARVHVEAMRSALVSERPAEVSLPGAMVFRSAYGVARVEPRAVATAKFELAIPGPGTFRWPGGTLHVAAPAAGGPTSPDDALQIASAAAPFPWTLRSRRPGDRVRPAGGPGSRKLKELLIDLKVPRWRRDAVALLEGPRGILWVVGLRACEPATRPKGDEPFWNVRAQSGAQPE
jgi:tRNA(Ile)-lysidine synthase